MKKELIEYEVQDFSFSISDLKLLIELWQKGDTWASELLLKITAKIPTKTFYLGRIRSIITALVVYGYTPAYEVIQKQYGRHLNPNPEIRFKPGEKGRPTQDYMNAFVALDQFNWFFSGRSKKKEILPKIREFLAREPIFEYEEFYWLDYFDFKTNTLLREPAENIIQLNKIVRSLNQNCKKIKRSQLITARSKIIKILYPEHFRF